MTTKIIHNCATNEIEEVEMTAKEIKALSDSYAQEQAARAEAEAKRQAVLDKLGLTADELASIL
jgi:Mn-containing catalase